MENYYTLRGIQPPALPPCAYCGQRNPGINYSYKGRICDTCHQAREAERAAQQAERMNDPRIIKLNIGAQNRRAKRAGLPGTLTLNQWLEILARYNWKCAYCREQPYQVIEHIIPINSGRGGTTAENCVPSCTTCNLKKGNR